MCLFVVLFSGKDYTMTIRNQECTVTILLEELYKKVSASNLWGLVRHIAGMLHKRVEDLGPVSCCCCCCCCCYLTKGNQKCILRYL